MKRWLLLLLVAAVVTGSAPAGAAAAHAQPLPDLTGRQILAFDPAGDGRVVEVVGDLRAADRIAVIVPGAAVTARNFLSGLGGVRRRSPSWQAHQLHEATGGR